MLTDSEIMACLTRRPWIRYVLPLLYPECDIHTVAHIEARAKGDCDRHLLGLRDCNIVLQRCAAKRGELEVWRLATRENERW